MKPLAEILSWSLNIAAAFAFGIICAVTACYDACYSRKSDEDAGILRR